MMTGFQRYMKNPWQAQFVEKVGQLVQGSRLWALIEPHYIYDLLGNSSRENGRSEKNATVSGLTDLITRPHSQIRSVLIDEERRE